MVSCLLRLDHQHPHDIGMTKVNLGVRRVVSIEICLILLFANVMAFEQDQFEYVDNISFNTSSWIVNTVYNYRHFESKATDFFSFCNAIDSQIQKLKQAFESTFNTDGNIKRFIIPPESGNYSQAKLACQSLDKRCHVAQINDKVSLETIIHLMRQKQVNSVYIDSEQSSKKEGLNNHNVQRWPEIRDFLALSCPSNFASVRHNGKFRCYGIIHERASRNKQAHVCKFRSNSTLVRIESREDAMSLQNFLANNRRGEYWVENQYQSRFTPDVKICSYDPLATKVFMRYNIERQCGVFSGNGFDEFPAVCEAKVLATRLKTTVDQSDIYKKYHLQLGNGALSLSAVDKSLVFHENTLEYRPLCDCNRKHENSSEINLMQAEIFNILERMAITMPYKCHKTLNPITSSPYILMNTEGQIRTQLGLANSNSFPFITNIPNILKFSTTNLHSNKLLSKQTNPYTFNSSMSDHNVLGYTNASYHSVSDILFPENSKFNSNFMKK